MLEALRQHSRSTIIYILFGVIIAVFVINFGPGSKGCESAPGSKHAAQVMGSTISEQDFRYAYIATGSAGIPAQYAKMYKRKEFIMDKLIERELFAQEAERLGLSVSEKEADDLVGGGKFMLLGIRRNLDDYVKVDGSFNYDRLKTLCQNRFGVTVRKFTMEQQKELMAERVRQLMLTATQLAPDEVKTDFEQRGLQVNLEYVRFPSSRYVERQVITPADVEGYKKTHDADLKKYYEEHSYLYKKLDKETRLRRVLIAVAKDAKPEEVAAAKTKAEEAAKKLKAGQAFEAVAKQYSDDERSKAKGGDMGWRKKNFTDLGLILEEKLFGAKPVEKGSLVGPERSERGWELVKVEGFREGDVPFDAVANDIAEEQLRTEKAKAEAKAEAMAAVEKAKAKAGTTLMTLYPKPTDADENADPAKRKNAPPAAAETSPFARRGDLVPGVGVSGDLMKRAFEMKQGDVMGPFEITGSQVVVQLKERKEPDMPDFEKRKSEILRQYQRQKWAETLTAWSKQRCTEAKESQRLNVNDEMLVYEGTKASPTEQKYEPCGGPKTPDIRLQ